VIYSNLTPISFQDDLPDAIDVVVIGAGVIGTCTAWYLRQAGLSVLLCDKGRVAGEQSSRNWGWIRQQGRDAAELPIVMDSIHLWEDLAKNVDTDIGFTRQGVLYAAQTDEEMARHEEWLEIAEQHQLDTRLITGPEIDALIDDKPGQWRGGMFTPSDGRAEPFKAVPAVARALQRAGGLIREGCAVRTVDVTAGAISGVVTEDGVVKAGSVVCASGAWSTLFLANLGINLPQLTVRATVARTARAPDLYDGNAALGEVAIRRRQDGGYTVASSGTNEHFINADSFRYFFKYLPALRASAKFISLQFGGDLVNRLMPTRSWSPTERTPFEEDRVLNPKPSARALLKMRAGLANRVPKLADTPFEECWAGMIDVTPDVVPVMDQVNGYPGLFLATGFSGHGFGIGPGAGRVMADMVTSQTPRHELRRFRMSRFYDGSRMEIGPGL
jgi:glycine/D-amino acid oxidase-like deaminating enzyme